MTVLGLGHGLIFVPVVLSLIGPTKISKPEKKKDSLPRMRTETQHTLATQSNSARSTPSAQNMSLIDTLRNSQANCSVMASSIPSIFSFDPEEFAKREDPPASVPIDP